MKIILKKTIIVTLFLILIWIILKNSNIVSENIIYAFDLCLRRVFPTLFPMFIISDILIKYGAALGLAKIFKGISSKLFKVSGLFSYVMIMSLLSGSPSNAIFVKDLYKNKYISSKEASKILSFTFFANPLLIYTFLLLILECKNTALRIIFVVYIGNFIIGLLFRNLYKDEVNNYVLSSEEHDFSKVLTEAIKKAMNNMIIIVGTITFFVMLSSLINEALGFKGIVNSLLTGILELASGLNSLINLNASDKLKGILAGIFISFGGFSIHMQIKSILNDTSISYKLFFIARIIHACITAILLLLIL